MPTATITEAEALALVTHPLVVDLATSIVSMGKIHHYAATGQRLEEGWAKDAQGAPTTDAACALDGAIAPFGGAKGYALGLALELIIVALADSPFAPGVGGTLDAERPCNKGDVFIVIDMRNPAALRNRIAGFLDQVRACEPADSRSLVSVPGDGARWRMAKARERGFEVDARLLETLRSLSSPTRNDRRGAFL